MMDELQEAYDDAFDMLRFAHEELRSIHKQINKLHQGWIDVGKIEDMVHELTWKIGDYIQAEDDE